MNYGNIEKNTAAGRVFEYLKARLGQWVDGWSLTVETKTTAISTRVSEIRVQVDRLGYAVEMKREKGEDGRPKFFYRLVMRKGLVHNTVEDVRKVVKERFGVTS
jgi:hypothetical protein